MKKQDGSSKADNLHDIASNPLSEKYLLKLYVTGTTPRSIKAIANIKKICETHLKGSYDLEVIDLYKHPELAKDEQIIAAPTLIKKLPAPLRRVIGDLSETERVLAGLNLKEIRIDRTGINADN